MTDQSSINASTDASEADLLRRGLTAFTKPQRKPPTQEDVAALNGGTRSTLFYRGLQLAAWIWGHGPSILLLHGWESRASHMAAFVPGLLEAGFRVVALDAPAHGQSEGDSTDVIDYGKAVVTVAEQLGEIHGVIAHSVGSAAALYAYAHGVQVAASVQLSGPSSLTRAVRYAGLLLELNESQIVKFQKMFADYLQTSLGVMDVDSLKNGLNHPALIIHDEQDRVIPASESVWLADRWPQAELAMVSGVGHTRILKDRETIARAVTFLQHAH